MALKGIKVVELAGLAPAPFCGMILSDFGASVIRVDRARGSNSLDRLARGKQSIAVDLKQKDGINVVKRMCCHADVLIEPYRKGVMERLGLGPDQLLTENPKLIYARMTGYGQKGELSDRAGHDINYISISGVLSRLGRKGDKPYAPVNLLADFAGGGMMCAMGIMLALLERSQSGKGQVIDANMVEGASYVSSFLWHSKDQPIWCQGKGEGWFDGGAPWYDTYETSDGKYMAVGAVESQFYKKMIAASFIWHSIDQPIWGAGQGEGWLDGAAPWYDTYETSDGKFMAVGAIEHQFYSEFIKGLGLKPNEAWQFNNDWPALRKKFASVFATKTQAEWCKIFDHVDACVTPVLSLEEAAQYPHNVTQGTFRKKEQTGLMVPRPAPHLSRTPGTAEELNNPEVGQHTSEILSALGYSPEEINRLIKNGSVEQAEITSRL